MTAFDGGPLRRIHLQDRYRLMISKGLISKGLISEGRARCGAVKS